ncbi:MAG: hybrid sensor histidine kinase/response regulator [Candidatus Omnitrophica bacterium]|nr:hybrid sensor histidine kinase/response regulator [Candidatus Omnitrophota bacterium]
MLEKTKILAVDDDLTNLSILKEIFEQDYELKAVSSGKDALLEMVRFHPDIVLLDVMMPEIDGYEVCRRIRGDDNLRSTKTIMISARAGLEDRLKGYEVGANDYVTKPFEDVKLIAKVKVMERLKFSEEVEKLKDNMLELLSHELRAPLNSILGFASLLKQNAALSETDQEYLDKITRAANQLTDLSRKIVLLSELSKEEKIFPRPIDVEETINRAILFRKSQIEEKKLNVQYGNKLKEKPVADPHLFEEAIDCLIDCIIESAPEDQKISITSTKHNDCWQISLNNSWMDFSGEDNVLDPFHMKGTEQYNSGVGLDLAIAKSVAQRHNGNLFVSNSAKHGCSFVFQIPLI